MSTDDPKENSTSENGQNGNGPEDPGKDVSEGQPPEHPEQPDEKAEVVLGPISVELPMDSSSPAEPPDEQAPPDGQPVGEAVSVSVDIPVEVDTGDAGGLEPGEAVGEPVGLSADIPVEVDASEPPPPEPPAPEPPPPEPPAPEPPPPEPLAYEDQTEKMEEVDEGEFLDSGAFVEEEPAQQEAELSVQDVASTVMKARKPGQPKPPPPPPGMPPPPPPPMSPGAPSDQEAEPVPAGPVRERTDVVEQALKAVSERQWAAQMSELQAEMEGEKRKPRLALLHHEIGEIQETRLKDESAAIKSYGEALKLHSGLMANLWAIRRMLYKRNKWPNLLKLIDGEIKLAASDEHRADLLLEKGELLETRLGDLDGARKSYMEAREAAPSRVEPMLRLEKLLLFQGDLEELARICELHSEIVKTPERRSAIIQGLARLMGQMGAGYEDRKALLNQALELGYNIEGLLWDLERISLKEGRFEDFLEVLEKKAELLEVQSRPTEALAVRRQQARMAAGQLGDTERAWEILQRQLDSTPEHPLLLSEMSALAWSTGRWEVLVELLERRLTGEGILAACDRQDVQLQLALAVSLSGDAERAVKLVADLSGTDEKFHPDSWLFRERRMLNAGDLEGLGTALEELGQLVASDSWPQPASDTLPFRARLTALRAHLLVAAADRAGPEGGSEEAEDESGQGGAGPADRLLEQAEGLCRHALEMDSGAVTAAYLLEEVLSRKGRWEELAAWHRERLESAEGTESHRLLESLVDLYALRLENPEEELRALKQLAELLPDDASTLGRLEAELENQGRWEEAASTLEKLADLSMDPMRQADLLTRAAELDYHYSQNTQSAAARLRSALEQAPEHAAAAVLMEEVLTRSERWEDLATLLRDEVERTLDESRLERLFCKLGEVLELRLGRPEEAAAVYEELLERFPAGGSALRALTRLWRTAGNNDRLADVLERQAELIEDAAVRSDLLFGVAELYEHKTGDPEKAEDACLRAFALSPHERTSLDALLRFYLNRSEWQKVAEVLEEHLRAMSSEEAGKPGAEEEGETAGDDDEYELEIEADEPGSPEFSARRLDIVEDLAWINESALQDPATASTYWGELADAAGPRARRSRWAAARQAVRDTDAAAYARQELGLAEDLSAEGRRVLELRAAIHRSLAGDDPEEIWERLAGDERDAAWVATVLLGNLGAERAAEVLKARAEGVEESGDRVSALRAVAALHERQGNAREAANALREVLGSNPDDLSSVEGLRRLSVVAGDKKALAAASVRAGELYADPERASAALTEGGRLLEELGSAKVAAAVWTQVLARRPEDSEAFKRLKKLLHEGSDWEALNRLYAHRLSVCDDDDEVVELRVERAALLHERLDDVRAAASDLHRALKIRPDEARASYRLGLLYAMEGDGDTAVEWLKSCVVDAADSNLRQKAQFTLAEVLEGRFEDPEGALQVLEDALADASEDDAEPLERMLSYHVRHKEWQEAADTLDRLRDLAKGNVERASVELRKAVVYRDGLANDDRARSCLETARALDPLSLEPVRRLADIFRSFNDDESVKQLLESASEAQVDAIKAEPLQSRAYSNLAAIQEIADEPERRFFATAALKMVGELSDEQTAWYGSQAKFGAEAATAKLSEEDWQDRLVHPAARQPAWELWQVVAGAVNKIHAVDLSTFGVGKAEKVSLKQGSGVFKEIGRLARQFGIKLAGVYRWEKGGKEIKAVPTAEGPVLLVGAKLEGREPDRAVMYSLGWELGAIKAAALPLVGRSEKEVDLLLTAAAIEGVPDYKHDHPASEVESLNKSLRRAMSRKARKAVPVAGMGFTRVPFDVEQWVGGLIRTFERVGLLVSGDLEAAARELLEQKPKAWSKLTRKGRVELLAKRADVVALILFAVSESFVGLRKALGLARGL